MRLKACLMAALLVLTAGLMNGCADTLPAPETKAATKPQITVLYDAFGKDAAMKKDWGYSALIEVNGKRILFDTGDDP